MNKIIPYFSVFFLLGYTKMTAQTVLEAAVTNDEYLIETWWVKPLDEAYKMVLFNLNTATYDFDTEQANFMSYSLLNFDIKKGFGPAIGTRVLKDRVVGLGGIQYTFYKEKTFITANFTSEIKGSPDFELYAIVQHRPQLTAKIKGFLQGQFSFNFNTNVHLFSFQQLRLGLDRGMLQGGIALNQFQFGDDWRYDFQPGLFLRLEFK